MSDQWDEDYDEYEDDGQTQRGNPVSELRKQLKEKTKAEKAMREELEKLRGSVRETTIGNVLKSRGLPDKVARIVPKDIDPTAEEVTKWLDEYGDVFGIQSEEKPEQKEETRLTDNQAAAAQMNSLASMGTAPGSNAQEALSALQSRDLTEAQLRELISRGGFK